MTHALTKTTSAKHPIVLRVIAGAPLLAFGIMHLSGAAPMRPLIEAAGLPMPGITATMGTLTQILAGLLLLAGAFVRVGGAIAILNMLAALYTHIQIPNDAWPIPVDTAPNPEPLPLMGLAAVIIIVSAYLLYKGAGAWSVDHKLTNKTQETTSDHQPTNG